MSKEVIAVDFDEVLFPFVQEFSKWHNNEYGTNLGVESFKSYDFDDILQLSVPETVHRIHTFFSVEHSHRGVDPLEQSQIAIASLSREYRLTALTARHPQFEDITYNYILQHFGQDIGDITLIGTKGTMDVVRTKAEVCLSLGAIALIDDSIDHVSGCAEVGVEGILFGDYPWNKTESLPEGVSRFVNWDDVLKYFGV